MPDRSRKPPRDANQLAKLVVDIAIGDEVGDAINHVSGKDPAAVSLGRRGGLKGGAARAKALSPKKRSEIARKAARARYGKKA